MASTNTILKSIEWAKKLNFGRRSAIGNFLEPALTSANIVKQAILGPPFEWRWNRKEIAWNCVDTTLVWAAAQAYPIGYRLKDSNGNLQTVTAIGSVPHQSGATQPTWSTDTTTPGTTTDGDLTWTASDIQTYIINIPTFGWIEHASLQDISSSTPGWFEIQSKLSLAKDSSVARPRYISAHTDDNAGNIGFVFMPVPDLAYPVNIHIQQKAPLVTSINDTWAPIPDEYSYIYNWGFLALMYMFADDPRFQMANQKFVAHLLASNEGLTETERNMFLNNWGEISGTEVFRAQQGGQARGL
jgi:hypothetical protein